MTKLLLGEMLQKVPAVNVAGYSPPPITEYTLQKKGFRAGEL